MYLFSKRSKKIVKYAWAAFSILVALSMIIAYSGFTRLSAVNSAPPTDISAEPLTTDAVASSSNTVQLGTATMEKIKANLGTSTNLLPVRTKPEQRLDFSL